MTEQEKQPPKRYKRKLLLLLIISALLLTAVLILPTLLSTATGKNFILGKVNGAIKGTVKADSLSLGWLSGVRVDMLDFRDENTSLKIKRFSARPALLPLLTGNVAVSDGLIDQPELILRLRPQTAKTPPEVAAATGRDQTVRPQQQTAQPSEPAIMPALPIKKLDLEIRQGSAIITLDTPKPQTLRLSNLASKVNLNPPGEKSTLDLVLAVAAAGQSEQAGITAKADITPAKGWTIKGTSGSFQIKIEKLQLADLQPLLALAGKEDIQLAGLVNADADVQLNDGKLEKIDAAASVENFRQTAGGQTIALDEPVKLRALAAYTGNGLQINALNLTSSFCALDCSGTPENLKYSAKTDLASIRKIAAQVTDFGGIGLTGSLAADGTVACGKDIIASAGSVEIRDFTLSKGGAASPATPVSLTHSIRYDKAAGMVQADSVKLALTGVSLNMADARLPLTGDTLGGLAGAATADIDMEKALPYVRPFAELPKDIAIAGLLTASVSATPADGRILVNTAGTNVKNLRISKPATPPFTQDRLNLDAQILLDPKNKIIDVKSLDLSSVKDQSIIHVIKGRFSSSEKNGTTSLAGSLKADYDLTQIAALASPLLPAELAMRGKQTGSLDFSTVFATGQPETKIQNLDASASFGLERAGYMGFELGPARLAATVDKGLLRFELPDAPLNGGVLRFAGEVDFKQAVPTLRMTKPATIVEDVRINDVITRNLLRFLNPIFANAVNAEGAATLSCRTMTVPLAAGHTKDLVIDGNVALADIRLQSHDLMAQILQATGAPTSTAMSLGPADFIVQNEQVSYDNMRLNIGSTPVIFTGSVGLDKSIKMNARFQISRGGEKLDVETPIRGTVDKPGIDVSKLIESLGRQLIEQSVQEQFKKFLTR